MANFLWILTSPTDQFYFSTFIINLMYQSSPLSQNQFYQHLTDLIHFFKLIFLTVDETVALMHQDQDYESSLRQIRKIINQEAKQVEIYDISLESHRHLHSAYHRFVCRLAENLAALKIKSSKEQQQILLVSEYVLRVQNCINFHKKQRNLQRLFHKIVTYTQKFCEGCDMLLSCCSQFQAVQILRKQPEEHRQVKEKQSKPIVRPMPHTVQSQSKFHKMMVVFNKRFATISCLDLDYNSYKSYCNMSRNDTEEELYKDFVNRNDNVWRAISRYSKHFMEYLRKRERTLLRNNRFRQFKDVNKTNERLESQQDKSHKKSREEHHKTIVIEPRTEESPGPSLPALKEDKRRTLEHHLDTRKEEITRTGIRGNYQLKSIYLTINKCHDKFQAQSAINRFMLNYSLPKPNELTKRSSLIKPKEKSLKSTQIMNQMYSPSAMMSYDKPEAIDSAMFDQMLSQSKREVSPRTTIIHRCHKQKKGEKRNIRINNLTFRGSFYPKIISVLDPENIKS